MILNEKGFLKQFNLVIYPVYFVVVIGDIEEEVNKKYSPDYPNANWIGKPGEGTAGTTYMVHTKDTNEECILIWFPTIEKCIGHYLCHEAGHAALETFSYIGATINPEEDQECFCYLLQTFYRLTAGCYEEFKDFKSKKSKSKKKSENVR